MMRKCIRIWSLVLTVSLLFGVVCSVTATVFADSVERTFFAFNAEANTAMEGLQPIVYDGNGGMTWKSDDNNLRTCSGAGQKPLAWDQREYIEADFSLDNEETQTAFAYAASDKQRYQITTDVNLKWASSKGAPWSGDKQDDYNYPAWIKGDTETKMGMGLIVEIYLYGVDAEGNEVKALGQKWVSPVEHPQKTVRVTIPEAMTAVTDVKVRLDNTSWRVYALKKVEIDIGALQVTRLDEALYVPADPEEGCIVDFTTANAIENGCSRSMISGATDMEVTESIFYPASGVHFIADDPKFGDNNKDWCWEDTCAEIQIEPGALSGYDGLECYVTISETTYTNQVWGINLSGYLPDRNEDGSYNYDENGEIKQAYVDFANGESDRPIVMKDGGVYKVQLDFSTFVVDLTKVPEDFGYYYDTRTVADCLQFIDNIRIGIGAMAISDGSEMTIDYALSDIYGYHLNEEGEPVSNLPAAEGYVAPEKEVADPALAEQIAALYEQLPKDAAAYENNPALVSELENFINLWSSMNSKTQAYLEEVYGLTSDDYIVLSIIYSDLGFGDLGDLSMDVDNPSNGVVIPVGMFVLATGAGVTVGLTRRRRRR